MAGSIQNCYNAGSVTGSQSNTGALVPGSGTVTNCYYLNTGTDSNTNATALDASAMRTELLDKLGANNWKTVRGVNNGYPILLWQQDVQDEMAAQKVTLAANAHFEREPYTTDDGEESSLPTGLLKWEAMDGATSYTVSLWQAVKTWMPLNAEEKAEYDAAKTAEDKLWLIDDARIIENMTDEQRTQLAQLDDAIDEVNAALDSGVKHDRDTEQKLRQALSDAYAARAEFVIGLATDADLGYYDLVLEWVEDIPGVTGTEYDLASRFAALPEGIYYASAAVETNGQIACVSLDRAENEVVTLQSPYNRMKAVTGVKWDDANSGVARWDGRENFTGNYRVDLYTVEGTDRTFYRSFTFAGQYTSANFTNVFAAEKKYAFKVTAIADYETESNLGLTNSIESDYSSVYNPAESTEDPSKEEWVDITTAEQWIALANVKDEPSDGTGSPSRQQVEWSKNYRLANDIDFSTLSAADQVKTKSIGTKTYPFMGEFDGKGYKITGLTLSNSDSGLFWYTGATAYVHDLTIEGANVLFSDNAAVLVHNNYGRIEKCAVVNTNITADTGAVLGGMVSRNYGVIRDSYVQGGTLTSNTTTSVGHAGFVGANEAGGLIERCWTSMSVSTQNMHAAGFVGLGYGGTIRNCFALGDVSARGYSGGFVGRSVYDGNVYENCYAAGTVTVTEAESNGFIGGNQSWSSFQYDQSSGITNCYYNSATNSSHDYNAVAKSLAEMKSDAFLTAISGSESGVWAQSEGKNNGLPYLENVKVPEAVPTKEIIVRLAVVPYNKATYSFDLAAGQASIKSITMQSNGNTRLVDVMDEAVAKGELTYEYATTSTYGRFIHTINGRAVDAPDGWMFIINDKLSNVSVSLATVKNGDTILWFEGTTENRFQGPTWSEVESGQAVTIEWVEIDSLDDLMTLAAATDADTLGKHYQLTADLDLKGVTFPGIGSEAAPFTGTFDGQGHTISNVTITRADGTDVGFFNVIKGATIKNLKLAKVNISGKENVGGLVGYAQAELDKTDLSKNKANLVGSCSVTGTVSGEKNVGGLIGLNAGVTDRDTLFSIASAVDKCAAAAAVNGVHGTGGLVGNNSGTITKSYANGAVTGKTTTGGLAGDNSGDIYDSHATGAVTGESHTGGFAGSSSGTVKNCYSTGAVTGTDYTGSFAGAISNAENAVGAGQVTIKGTPTQGFNGGFAGQLNGTISGLPNQITVKNVYGNCTQPDGTTISPIGNTSGYQSEAQKNALKEMELNTWDDVNEKLKELFGVSLFSAEPTELMDTIAGTYINTKDTWAAMDMAAYQKLAGKTAKLTDEARQNVINLLITEAAKDSTGVNARTRIELVLHSLGVDTTRLYPVNSNTPVSNAAKLRTAADTVNNSNDAAWVLLANSQGSAKLTTAQVEKLVKLMTDELSDGDVYIWSYGGDSGVSYDVMATALVALQPYVNSSSAAKNLAGRLLNALQTKIAQDPLFGNANTDAMVVIGLIAAGVDPDTVKCANGMTLTQDMLRYVTADGQGFWFADSSVVNPLATEQAFRALVALAQFKATGKAFNIYDFSDVKTGPSHATGEGETSKPADEPEGRDKITVTVTISTPSGIWLNNKSVTVTEGSTVYHAFIKALKDSDIKQVGAENGYVSFMTKGGVTYGEFTSGTNSGWLYKVNGVLPNVPLTQKAVNNNDYVLWYYTTDWKADPDAGKMADEEVTAADVIKLIDAIGTVTRSSGNAIAAARTAYNKLSADQKALVTNYAKLTAAETAYAELIKEQTAGEANTETADGWRKTYSDALDSVKTDELVFGSEWLVIALARSGRDVPDSYYDSVVKAVQEARGELGDKKFTEYSRTILALTAIGKDPTDVGGYDLLAKLADMDDVTYQGLNGAIFALIALDSGKYDVPAAAEGGKQTTRDGLLAYILEQQLSDGGWALSGDNADPDMTAMALQALAPYRTGDAAVLTAVDKALQVLSDMQQADGGYSSWSTLNSESCAQVLIALASLGIDSAADSRFAKNGLTVLDALLAYALDGGFRHTADGKADAIATEQALCAMTAYARLLDGKTALYDMADVLGGQTADTLDDTAADEQPAKTTPVVVWIALGVVALGGGTALIVVRRRRGE